MKEKITIVLPPIASSNRELDLVNLTEYLTKTIFKCEWQGGGLLGGEFGYGVDYENDTFAMRMYYWGDCTCGWEAMEFKGKHIKDCFRTKYQQYEHQLKKEKVEWYSEEWIKKCGDWSKAHGNKDGWAGSGVYCDCSHDKLFKEWFEKNKKGKDGHADNCELILPNFKYKKTGIEVRWYKYIGRDMEYSKKITDKEWQELIEDCVGSIPKPRSTQPKVKVVKKNNSTAVKVSKESGYDKRRIP